MERQKSFSFKSTRFLLFSVTIFTSLIFLSFFSVWFVKSTPFVLQQADLINLNTSSSSSSSISLGFRSVSVQVLTSTGPSSIGNSSASTVEKPNLALTHFRKPENTSGFEIIKGIGEKGNDNPVAENGEKDGDGAGVIFTALVESDSGVSSAPTEKKPNLDHTHFGKPENSSGFEIMTGIGEKGNENQVAENGEKGGNLTAMIESDSGVSAQEIEVISSERSEEKREKMDSVEKIEGQSSKRVVEKKIGATSVKKIESLSNVKIEDKRVRECDVTKGKWVYDESYPLYTNTSCPFIDEGFSCQSNGRLDKGYMKWRWQPQDCDIPRFNATKMLELIRGKRLVFVGDSINRNQWESMLCLLMGAIKDPKKVYETHGRRITKEKGIYSFKFVDYKCTVEYYVTHFLVHESKARVGQKRVPTLRIDAIDHGSSRWRGADILVFNTAHWWSHFKTKSGINYYQERDQVHPRLDVSSAFRRALTTWASWVDSRINPRKTKVFFRSSAPSHFRGGQWNSGGHCREATVPLNETSITDYSEKNIIVEDVIKQMRTPVTLLNITGLSGYRIDGHPSVYGRSGKRFSPSIQDCSHWCLPGIPDTWNELLYFHLTTKQK